MRVKRMMRTGRQGVVRWMALIGCVLVGWACLWLVPGAARGGPIPPQSVVESVRQAEGAYEAARYDEALDLYRRVLASGWTSAALYYNLGCASFKAGRIGWAVAYLEEARQLSPRDPSIRRNLAIALSRGRDRLPEEGPSWLLDLMAGLLDSYAPSDVVRGLLALLWIGALGLAATWLRPGGVRRWARGVLLLVAVLIVLGGAGLALKAYQIASAPSGVVVAREAHVLSGPREGETVQFVLHEGTLLHLGRAAGAWREVWLSDEMRGWLSEEAVATLRGPWWLP